MLQGYSESRMLTSDVFEICNMCLHSWFEFMLWLQGLKNLTKVAVTHSVLENIPVAFADLSALTSLDLRYNEFWDDRDWPWWPSALSR
jgi:hypothetical protein